MSVLVFHSETALSGKKERRKEGGRVGKMGEGGREGASFTLHT